MQYRTFIDQMFYTAGNFRTALDMIREHQLWEGINRYGWVVRVLFIVGLIISLSFFSIVIDWVGGLFTQPTSPLSFFSSMGSMVGSLAVNGYESFTSGLLKYVVLILSEVVIFHFMQRTLEVLTGKPIRTDFATFLKAQIRMLKVVFRVYILELICTVIISIVFGIFGLGDSLESVAQFIVQCYFFGLIILDNYNEQFGMRIKESMVFSRQFGGVSLVLGFVLYVLMLIPVLGVVAGTILVSVNGAIVMNRLADLKESTANNIQETGQAQQ